MSLLIVHLAGGAAGIVTGAVALFSGKGGPTHRRWGTAFAWSMTAMTVSAFLLGLAKGQYFNASQAALTCYLVVTALHAARAADGGRPRAMWLAAAVALAIAAWDLLLGLQARARPSGMLDGMPAGLMFVFAGVTLLAAAGDLRWALAGGARGRQRIARHLWRMCLALWIACGSFFLGQAKVIPEPLRIMPLLALPVVVILLAMLYWMVRTLRGRTGTAR